MPRKSKEQLEKERQEAFEAQQAKLPPAGATFVTKNQEPINDMNVQTSPNVQVPVSDTAPLPDNNDAPTLSKSKK